jgi:hypothetical protein
MEKLPEDFKKKFTAALRSGEFKQGEGKLYEPNNDTYCCMGVAGKICGYTNLQLANETYIGKFFLKPVAGFPELLQYNSDGEIPIKLAKMNDGSPDVEKRSFSEIADWIDENL